MGEDDSFAVIRGRWVEARYLQVGDILLSCELGSVAVEQFTRLVGTLTIYNLHIANCHTYLVGRNAVLVHNTSPDPDYCNPANFSAKNWSAKVDVIDPVGAPMGGPKDGKYIVYHGTNDVGAKSISTNGIDSNKLGNPDEFQVSIDPQQAAHFGADEVTKKGGSVKLVRYEMSEDMFLDLFRDGHITQSAASNSVVFDKVAQEALNKAAGP